MYKSYAGKERTNSNIAWHSPQSSICRVEEELMQNSQKASTNATDPLEKLRLLCLSHGAAGIMRLGRVFRKLVGDHDGVKHLNKEEFEKGIKETGLELTNQETDELFKRFDKEDKGSISLDDFLKQVRPPMVEMRRSIVEQAFKKLDRTGDGMVTVDDIRNMYSVHSNSSYVNGDNSAELILNKFLVNFEQQEAAVGGKVTLEEFMNYYSGISVSIENDCFFDLMMRQAYKL